MRWYWATLLALALIVAVPLGGLWLWGRPRGHVSLPTATTSPANVVHAYARAMNERDFTDCKRMGVGGGGDIGANWTTLHGPQMYDVTIRDVGKVMTGAEAAKFWSDPGLSRRQQTVDVETSETTKHFDSTPDPEPGHAYDFELVRHDSAEPWRIYDFGEG